MDMKTLLDFLGDYTFGIILNANDTFGWACADITNIDIEDLPALLDVYQRFGGDGVIAFQAHYRDEVPIGPLKTDAYKLAMEYLKDFIPLSQLNGVDEVREFCTKWGIK